jgi:hypothetical protein
MPNYRRAKITKSPFFIANLLELHNNNLLVIKMRTITLR